MKRLLILSLGLLVLVASDADAQRRGKRNKPLAKHPQAVGDPGIAWYTTWKSGLAEARRSNRPIFFMSAATCQVPGAF